MEAAALIQRQITAITEHWQEVCDEADLSHVDRKLFAGRQFLNSYALEGLDDHMAQQNAFRAARDLLISG